MTVHRMDHVSIVIEDLDAAIAFFRELGLEQESDEPQLVEGPWVDAVNGLDGVRVDIVMMRTPDGHGRVELTRFRTPAVVGPESITPNTVGLRSLMFEVDDVDAAVERLRAAGHGLVGEIAQYEDIYRLCYVRGPEGVIVALAEDLR
jgi:catechol 2,3-dioxygenase-like lactoylglutathione lyase family enzyme